jgi:hypothetical protein
VSEIFKDWPRFDGLAAWPKLSPEEQAEIGALALELVVASRGMDVAYCSGLEETPVARPFLSAATFLNDRLEDAVGDAIAGAVPAFDDALSDAIASTVLAHPDHACRMPLPSLIGPVCRSCGCYHEDPCDEGCGWAEEDLCTACVGRTS